MKKFVVAIGTRPDVIKMRPVIDEMRQRGLDVRVWWSGQGKDIQDGAILPVDCDTGGVEWNEGLSKGISGVIEGFGEYLKSSVVDCVLVHGDDGTAYGAAVAAYLSDTPIIHVEAGLRTYERTPWPEEGFRRMIGAMAEVHLAPDWYAAQALGKEKVNGTIHVVGNTVVDTLEVGKPKALVTLHRRENWGDNILHTLRVLYSYMDDFDITVIRHPNWDSHLDVDSLPDLDYCSPLGRAEFIQRLGEVDIVITDSGGLQEECALLGIPCYVMRENTERQALKENGAITLCTTPAALENELAAYLGRRYAYGYPGAVSTKIVNILENIE